MEAVVRGFSYVERHSNAVSGSGKIAVVRYGHVLRARGLVGVHGAGRPFDGVHWVASVTHEIKRGSYKQ
jgi:hypothetical protein